MRFKRFGVGRRMRRERSGGGALIDDGAHTLITLQNLIDTDRIGRPSFAMVLTATGDFAYRREDGVIVCPIGCLKP